MFERIKNFLKRIFSRLSPDENVLYYINTPDALPHPYSAEEENALISRLSGGELAVRNDLIEQKYQIIKYENYIYKAMAGRYEAVSPAGE